MTTQVFAQAKEAFFDLGSVAEPMAALRVSLSYLSPLWDEGSDLPTCWLQIASRDGEVGAVTLKPLGIIKGQAMYEVAQLHPAGSQCPPGQRELSLGRLLETGLSEWPPLTAA